MKLATTTEDFCRFYQDDKSRVKELADAGFKCIDFSLFGRETDKYMEGDWKNKVRELKTFADDLGVKFVQMHSPAFFEAGVHDADYELGLKTTIRSIEICKELGIEYTVVHGADNPSVKTREQKFELNRDWYKQLFPVMEQTGVQVLTENSPSTKRLDWWFPMVTGKDMYDLCEYVSHPLFHACWDTGHANIQNNQYDDIVAIGKHLKAVHFNDNDGVNDLHTAPFMGTMNVDEIMHALIDIGYSGALTFESPSILGSIKRRRQFEKDNRLILAPIEVYRASEKLLYEIGKSILTTYGLFEE
ncbi:MAG: sugar phosphate isomerase/epimerase [Clostridia bacterium]|nr:sugar phosphate isomerase/epimerase [Clostridia bacterium]